jgi:hypothetical protein
LHLTLACKLAP